MLTKSVQQTQNNKIAVILKLNSQQIRAQLLKVYKRNVMGSLSSAIPGHAADKLRQMQHADTFTCTRAEHMFSAHSPVNIYINVGFDPTS